VLNGLPVMRINNVGEILTTAGFTLVGQPHTWFGVVDWTATPSTVSNEAWHDNGGTNRIIIRNGVSGGVATYGAFGGTSTFQGALDANPHVWCMTFNGANSDMRIDGTSLGTSSAGTNGFDSISLGGSTQGNVDIGEVVVCSGTVTAGQKKSIEEYLGSKWGITVA